MDSSLFKLEGKSALGGGSSLGMGDSTAKFLVRAGCDVAVADVAKERADHVAAAATKPAG